MQGDDGAYGPPGPEGPRGRQGPRVRHFFRWIPSEKSIISCKNSSDI